MGMQELGAHIRQLREAKGVTQEELGDAAGVSHSAISKIELGKQIGVDIVLLGNLAAALGESRNVLESLLRDEPLPRAISPDPELPREIPIVAIVSLGHTGGGVIEGYEYVGISDTRGRLLRAVIAEGTCMEPEIRTGDVVIYDARNRSPRDGQLVVAVVPDEANERGRGVVKQFYALAGKIKLSPLVGQPIILPADDVRIEGVVVEVRRKFTS